MIISAFSKRFSQKAGKAEDLLRNIVTGGTLFNELGFYYVGPIDGHDVENLAQIFENVKTLTSCGPVQFMLEHKKEKVINLLKNLAINIMEFLSLMSRLGNNQNQSQLPFLYKSFC